MRFMLSIGIIWPCPWRYSFQPQHFSRSFLISTRLDLLFCSIAFPFTFLYFIISKKPSLRFPNYFHDSFCIALRETNQANFGYHLKLIQKIVRRKLYFTGTRLFHPLSAHWFCIQMPLWVYCSTSFYVHAFKFYFRKTETCFKTTKKV